MLRTPACPAWRMRVVYAQHGCAACARLLKSQDQQQHHHTMASEEFYGDGGGDDSDSGGEFDDEPFDVQSPLEKMRLVLHSLDTAGL